MSTDPLNDQINDFIVANYQPINGVIKHLSESIAEQLGVAVTETAVASRIKRLRASNKIAPYETGFGVVVSAASKEVAEEITYEQRVMNERVKLLSRQRDAQERAEIIDQAKFDNLLATIQNAVTPIDVKFSPMLVPHSFPTDESVVLVLSDLHFGKKTGTYNMEIALSRFVGLIDNVLRILDERNKIKPVKEIYILWTGDIIDGEQIYATHGSHIDDHVVNQIFKSLEIVVPQVLRFTDAGYTVHNKFVRGNHGRVSKFHHEVTNWDYIYGLTMQTMMKGVPNMTFNVTPNWHQVVNVQGNRILQWHGHQIKMHLNLPWYSLTARISRWAICEELEDFDISVSGHFHSSSVLNWNEKKLFTNGTMVSGDQFALEFIGLAASECQHLFGVDKSGVTWRYEVSFGE